MATWLGGYAATCVLGYKADKAKWLHGYVVTRLCALGSSWLHFWLLGAKWLRGCMATWLRDCLCAYAVMWLSVYAARRLSGYVDTLAPPHGKT